MRTQKQWMALLLVLSLLVGLSACGKRTPNSTAADGEIPTKTTVSGETETTAPGEAETPAAGEAETTTAGETETTAPGEEGDFAPGAAADGRYTSEFLGIGCDLGEDWTFYTDEQIREANQISQELVGEELADTLKNASYVTDMIAYGAMSSTVNVCVENLGMIYGSVLSEEQYVKIALPTLEEAMNNMGGSDLKIRSGDMAFAGKTHQAIFISLDLNGTTIYETLVCVKKGRHMGVITATGLSEETVNGILETFYPLG